MAPGGSGWLRVAPVIGQNPFWDPSLVGAPPILEPILVGMGMFTGGYDLDFDPWPGDGELLPWPSDIPTDAVLCVPALQAVFAMSCETGPEFWKARCQL